MLSWYFILWRLNAKWLLRVNQWSRNGGGGAMTPQHCRRGAWPPPPSTLAQLIALCVKFLCIKIMLLNLLCIMMPIVTPTLHANPPTMVLRTFRELAPPNINFILFWLHCKPHHNISYYCGTVGTNCWYSMWFEYFSRLLNFCCWLAWEFLTIKIAWDYYHRKGINNRCLFVKIHVNNNKLLSTPEQRKLLVRALENT